jgi:4-hydroxybenzoate polyprenyltransferase
VRINPATLPYHQEVLSYLKQQKEKGRKIWLVSACDISVARQVAEYLQLFDGVMATQGEINLSGDNKARALVDKFGLKGFEYVGNSRTDLPVWGAASVAHAVTNSRALKRKIAKVAVVGRAWKSSEDWWKATWTALRPHQWVKNLLLLVPMLADHQVTREVVGRVGLGMVVFCMVASAIYMINDMLDLEADRGHPTKKNRPFAAGRLPVWQGMLMAVGLAGTSFVLGVWLGGWFVRVMLVYVALNLFYSLGAKQVVLLDVIVLAVLYGLRILAGGAAAKVAVSDWLIALILFLALSGALMKRFIELNRIKELEISASLSGRGYGLMDTPLVGTFGVVSGYMAVLVMALYLNSTQVSRLYHHPEYWWVVALLMLYGISRGWLNAYRGRIDDDPIIYIIKDPIYYWIIGLTVILALLAI